MKNLKDTVKYFAGWIPALFIFATSFYLSSQETIEQMPSFFGADKIVHFICFGGLTFWVCFALRIRKFSRIWIPVLIVSVYGILDEIHQSFTPGRSCSIFDWMADTSGAFMGACVFILTAAIIAKLYSGHKNKNLSN